MRTQSRGGWRWESSIPGFGLSACLLLCLPGRAPAQAAADPGEPATTPQRNAAAVTPEVALLQALRNNPLTAPFRFRIDDERGRKVLRGRVGTSQAHDAAIRTAIALGVPVRDDLVIDTTEAYRAAAEGRWNGTAVPTAPPLGWNSYVYPPPLMGRVDDPFYGFEPPIVSYPPWWGGVAAREPLRVAAVDPTAMPAGAPVAGPVAGAPRAGAVELTLDERGVAFLRGKVPTQAQGDELVEKVRTTPGVAQVVNLLEVDPTAPPLGGTKAGPAAARGSATPNRDVPPPPPKPAIRPGAERRPPAPPVADPPPPPADDRPIRPAQTPGPAAAHDDPLALRVSRSLGRRPALAALPLRVAAHDGEVTLSGRVPSAYEAMLAFRAAEQTPGVRQVTDRLEFDPPDTDRPNPLREKARPDDLQPYLLALLRRQLGDLAHVDQVRVNGDTLDISGTVAQAGDVPRVEAALRSVPILRGFRLTPRFRAD